MFFIRSILLCILAIGKYTVQEEAPFFANNDVYDLSTFSDVSSFTGSEDFQGTSSMDLVNPTDSTLAFLNDDQDESSLIFADSNESCPFETSHLTGTISRRAGPNECTNPDSDDSGLNAPNINPKIAPFIDIQTMELKTICPGESKNLYAIAVCSSGRTGDVVLYPPNISDFDLFWAQKSECLKCYVSVRLWRGKLMHNQNVVNFPVLLACVNPRYIFCCTRFLENYEDINEKPVNPSSFWTASSQALIKNLDNESRLRL